MRRKIAYIMSRFPMISETFILYEILELERLGLHIEIFPLLRQNESVKHAEVEALADRVHYNHVFSMATLTAQLYWLYKRPRNYLLAWWRAIYGNFNSKKFLSRALVVVPLAALFARQMQKLNIEHIHAHWATHPALAAYIAQQLTGLTYSFTTHANDIYVEQSMLDEKIHNASSIVTISEYNRQFLHQLYGTEATDKTVVIHCGIDPNVFQSQAATKQTEQFTIICVARLEEKKGHTYLIKACAQLDAQGVNFRCLLIGDGEKRPQIEAQIEQFGLADRLILLGLQPRHRIKELLAEANVMVLASIITKTGQMEGIPVALMEALAMELPVIATAISGIPELIKDGETGLLVPERDPQAITTALLNLYNSPELGSELGRAGRIKVLQEFNLHRNVAKLYHILSQDWANTDIQ